MIFKPTPLAGARIIEIERREDVRGFFARTWCRQEFEAQGLNPNLAQASISFNAVRGTLRGMHFQTKPHEEAKLVRCTRGSIHDVMVDLRRDSPSFGCSFGLTLSEVNRTMLYIPEGFAHGFLTLEGETEVLYQISEIYVPDHSRGFRWDDPAFGIRWPAMPVVMSERDRCYPDFSAR